jgi:hypothetical protein
MSAAAGRVADPKKKSSATMRHEQCQTAKPSTRGRASHVGCIPNSQTTRSDDESRSVVEGRAHHDDE